MLLHEALDAFVLQLQADGRSVHTIKQYSRHLRLFSSWLAANGIPDELDGITTQTIALFLTSLMARQTAAGATKLATSTNALRTSVRVFFQFCELASYVQRSPGMLVRRARCGEPPPRALCDVEVERLLAAASKGEERDELLVRLLLGTGLRLGEALALEVGDIDLRRGTIAVRTAKGDRPRVAFVPAELGARLAEWTRDREGRLFPISGRHAQRVIGRMAREAGVTASAHCLRHTVATRVYARTGDLGVVQRVLGHASVATTVRYARAEESAVRRAMGA
ncbi:MAG: tyrosine-type recombinase/integrase [Planctomycetes bacterium]|jgi:site-specific recombinase XerD|nr:tyrosine-type recombinase/integrase [Planctomycetota bacterium]